MSDKLGPVEIEYQIPKTIASDFDNLINKVEEVGGSAGNMAVKLNEGIMQSSANINKIKSDLLDLQQAYSSATTKSAKGGIKSDMTSAKKALLEEAAALKSMQAELKAVESATRSASQANTQYSASVNSLHGGANRLGFATQQLARELPAATLGLGTFFLAISNNIPILTDEIQRTKNEVKLLQDAGKQATPVWKQLLSSVFSWQTALMVGVTLLTIYGKEIASWGAKLFSGSKALDEMKKSMKDLDDKTADTVGKQKALFMALSLEYSKLGENMKDKKRFVDENKESFKSLGVEVKNVADAENLLITNKGAFIEAIKAKARAAAAMDIAGEKYKEGLKKMQDVEKAFPVNEDADVKAMVRWGVHVPNYEKNRKGMKEADDLLKAGDEFIAKSVEQKNKAAELMGNANIKADKTTVSHEKKQYDSAKALQQQLLEIQAKTTELGIKEQEDGLAKRLAQLDFEKAQEVQKIKDKNAEIVAAYNESKGLKGDAAVTDISQIDPAAAKAQAAALVAMNKAYEDAKVEETRRTNEEIAIMMDELTAKNKSSLDAQLDDIDRHYDKLTKKAEGNAKAIELINQARNTDKSEAKGENRLKELNDEEVMAQKRLDVSQKVYLFETEKEKEKLQITRSFALKRLKVLEQMQASGVKDLEDKIKKAKQEIDGVSNDLNANDWKQLKEASGYARQLSQAFVGVNDELANTLNDLANIADGLSKVASGDYIGGGIQIFGEILKAISESNKEVYNKNYLQTFTQEVHRLSSAIEMMSYNIDHALGKEKLDTYKNNIHDLIQGSLESMERFHDVIKNKWLNSAYTQIKDLSLVLDGFNSSGVIDMDAFQLVLSDIIWAKTDLESMLRSELNWSEEQKKAAQEQIDYLEKTQQELEKYMNSYKEALTGTTSTTITDSIIEGFRNGYSSAADFADNFKSLMKDAVLQSLKVKALEKPLSDWYDQFAKANETDGTLTAQEIADLQARYNEIINSASSQFEALKGLSGLDFSTQTDTTRSGLSGSVAQASQESIDIFSGRVLGMQALLTDLRNIGKEDQLFFRSIESMMSRVVENTEYCRLLEAINNRQADWDNRGIKIKMS